MFTPPDPPSPPPNPNRDDEWIGIVIALGVLGITAAWGVLRSPAPLPIFQDTGTEETTSPPRASLPTDDAADEAGTASSSPPRSTQLNPPSDRATGGAAEGSDPRDTPSDTDDSERARHAFQFRRFLRPEEQPLQVPPPAAPLTAAPATSDGADRQPPLAFADLPEAHWAKPFIDELTARRILVGLPDGTFAPERAMTRAELAAQLVRTFELETADEQPTPPAFSDIAADNWASQDIRAAVVRGFMKGYPNALFRPEQPVSRAQAIAAIVAGLEIQPAENANAILQRYPDTGDIPTWARESIAAAASTGIIAPPTAQAPLRPQTPATRAEVAAMLYQGLVYMGRIEAGAAGTTPNS